MKVPIADLSDFVEGERDGIVTVGDLTVKVQIDGAYIVLWPERSYKHRDMAKRLGFSEE